MSHVQGKITHFRKITCSQQSSDCTHHLCGLFFGRSSASGKSWNKSWFCCRPNCPTTFVHPWWSGARGKTAARTSFHLTACCLKDDNKEKEQENLEIYLNYQINSEAWKCCKIWCKRSLTAEKSNQDTDTRPPSKNNLKSKTEIEIEMHYSRQNVSRIEVQFLFTPNCIYISRKGKSEVFKMKLFW